LVYCIYSVYILLLFSTVSSVFNSRALQSDQTKENSERERESTQKHTNIHSSFILHSPFSSFQFSSHLLICILSILIFLGFTFSPQILFLFFTIFFFSFESRFCFCGCVFFCQKIQFFVVGKWKRNWFLSGLVLFIRAMMLTSTMFF
jgi:hypothetical protein